MSDAIDFEQMLAAVPAVNAAVRVERGESGIVLFVPLRERAWSKFARWVFPLRTERGYALDRLGEEVFYACDGKSTLETIVAGFAERHQLRFHEARLCVMHFIRTLSERNLVALAVPAAEEGERS